ncbi:MAG: DUF4143 domain-containing protein, partial [Fibrobacteria bacterium]|nr:DUF4143 domain-containing protein [Fibrobacteria bacterium]
KGQSFESFVITQIRQLLSLHYSGVELFHWRSAGGAEVDLIIKAEGNTIPLEIKLSKSPNKNMTKGLHAFMKDMKLRKGYVIYPGKECYSLGHGIHTLPLHDFLMDPRAFIS